MTIDGAVTRLTPTLSVRPERSDASWSAAAAEPAAGWRYWARPWRAGRALGWKEIAESDRAELVLLEHPAELAGPGPLAALLSASWRLAQRLEALAAGAKGARQLRAAFYNGAFVRSASGRTQFETAVGTTCEPDVAGLRQAAIPLFKAVSGFLRAEDRFVEWEADIVLCYATWQWYALLKAYTARDDLADCPPALDYEFALAHRTLAADLEDPRLAYGFQVLSTCAREERVAGALVLERLRLSLPLVDPAIVAPADPFLIQSAPGSMGAGPVSWSTAMVHPRFAGRAGRRALRRLITGWLLPRYDVASALRLADLMHPRGGFSPRGVLLPVAVTLVILLVAGVGGGADAWIRWLVGVSVGVGAAALFSVDRASLPHIVLPRLVGGIALGYLPLVMDDAPWQLVWLLAPGGSGPLQWPWTMYLLWTVCVVLAGSYMAAEALGITGDRREALRRAGAVLAWAITLSMLIGLLLTTFAWPIYSSVPVPTAVASLPIADNMPLVATLTFAPLALLIGTATQFIWEHDPITTPLWLPER